jgi:hypothetical protein
MQREKSRTAAGGNGTDFNFTSIPGVVKEKFQKAALRHAHYFVAKIEVARPGLSVECSARAVAPTDFALKEPAYFFST